MNVETNDKVLKTDLSSAAVVSKTLGKAKALTKDFDDILKQKMQPDAGGDVSEEDLFAAVTRERVMATKGDDALKKYDAAFDLAQKSGNGSVEDSTKTALKAMRSSDTISADEADSIYSYSFAAAQLDSNKDVLYDSKGGANDPTRAVAKMEQALLGARTVLEQFAEGKELAGKRSLDEVTAGKPSSASASKGSTSEVGGSGGFLYKPVSDSDGKLAVLFPSELAGQIAKVNLIGGDGKILESGRSAGNGNGGRDHYRFNKPGGEYPDGMTVQATLNSGQVVKYVIEDSSSRVENGVSQGTSSNSTATTSINKSAASSSGSSPVTKPAVSTPAETPDL